MNTLKTISLIFSQLFFKVLVLLVPILLAVVLTLGNTQVIKDNLERSGVYGAVVDEVLAQASQQPEGQKAINQAALQDAARTAFPTPVVQQSAEKIIDGTTGWLEGKTETPQFAIDLTSAKQSLADNLVSNTMTRVQGLPVCTAADLSNININDIDPFTIGCQPPGVNLNAEAEKVRAELLNNNEFLPDPVITTEDLPKTANGQDVFANMEYVPTVYQVAKPFAYLSLLAMVIFGALVYLLYNNKGKAFKSISLTLLLTGIFLGLFVLITAAIFNQIKFDAQNIGVLAPAATKLFNSFANNINQIIGVFTAGYVILGIVAFVLRNRFHPSTVQPPSGITKK